MKGSRFDGRHGFLPLALAKPSGTRPPDLDLPIGLESLKVRQVNRATKRNLSNSLNESNSIVVTRPKLAADVIDIHRHPPLRVGR